jgi:hypothetical protein
MEILPGKNGGFTGETGGFTGIRENGGFTGERW